VRTTADSPLAFLATVQNLEADLLHHALNKAAGKSPNAHLTTPTDYTLKLPAGSLSTDESAAGFRALVTFTFAANAHKNFLAHLLESSNITPPKPGKYQLNVPRANLASLLDTLYPLAEITQRSYLAAISQLSDLQQIQQLAAIHSVKSAQLATLAMVLSADPHPRRFDTDEQCARTQFAENDLEYFRDPKLLIESLNEYTLS
jgi:hypothetical protein